MDDLSRFRRCCAVLLRSEPVPALRSRAQKAATIQNVVGSVYFQCAVDMRAVLKRHASAYQPKFTSVVIRLKHPYCTMLVFANSFCVGIGSQSRHELMYACHLQRKALNAEGLRTRFRYFSIDNTVVSGSVPYDVDIEQYEDDFCEAVMNEYVFPALIMHFHDPEATALIFHGGTFMMVGLSRAADVDTLYQHMQKVLESKRASTDTAHTLPGGDMCAASNSERRRQIVRLRSETTARTGTVGGAGVARTARADIQLLPKQRVELMRRVNLRCKGMRGAANLARILHEELDRYREELAAINDPAGKRRGGAKRKAAAPSAPAPDVAAPEDIDQVRDLVHDMDDAAVEV